MNLEFNPCSIMLASCKCYGRSKRGKLTRNKYRSLQRYVNAVKFYIAFVTFDFTVRRVEFNELFRLCNRQQSCLTLSTDFYLAFNARQLKHKISTRDIKVKKKRERERERENTLWYNELRELLFVYFMKYHSSFLKNVWQNFEQKS